LTSCEETITHPLQQNRRRPFFASSVAFTSPRSIFCRWRRFNNFTSAAVLQVPHFHKCRTFTNAAFSQVPQFYKCRILTSVPVLQMPHFHKWLVSNKNKIKLLCFSF
jgi:hypothetical protein